MLRSFLVGASVIFLAGSAAAGPADWLKPQADYTADTLMEASQGQMRGKVFASGMKERREFNMGGRQHIMIVRRDKNVSWVLMPEQKMYLENPLGKDGMPQDEFAGGKLEREKLGTESVNGVDATKYRVHGETPDGQAFEGTMWMTKQEIPVRIRTGKGAEKVHMELSNLKVGAVDPGHFEIPSGYSRFQIPGPAQMDLDALRKQYGR